MRSLDHRKTKPMNFRERIEQSRERLNDPLAANDNELNETGFDSEFFGIDNIKSFPACIDLRLADGSRKAMPYSFITEINFDASDGIEITTTAKDHHHRPRPLQTI